MRSSFCARNCRGPRRRATRSCWGNSWIACGRSDCRTTTRWSAREWSISWPARTRMAAIERQAEEVDRVKRSESGMIVDPITVDPEQSIADARALMARYRISGVPVTKAGKLVGILTNRDLRFETRSDIPISEVMTKENLVTVAVGTTLEQAEAI